nr:MAG TPA: hypothetical protein [Caudoviricetes sp.]
MLRLDELDAPGDPDLKLDLTIQPVNRHLERNPAYGVSDGSHIVRSVAPIRHGRGTGNKLEGVSVKCQIGSIGARGSQIRVVSHIGHKARCGNEQRRNGGNRRYNIEVSITSKLHQIPGFQICRPGVVSDTRRSDLVTSGIVHQCSAYTPCCMQPNLPAFPNAEPVDIQQFAPSQSGIRPGFVRLGELGVATQGRPRRGVDYKLKIGHGRAVIFHDFAYLCRISNARGKRRRARRPISTACPAVEKRQITVHFIGQGAHGLHELVRENRIVGTGIADAQLFFPVPFDGYGAGLGNFHIHGADLLIAIVGGLHPRCNVIGLGGLRRGDGNLLSQSRLCRCSIHRYRRNKTDHLTRYAIQGGVQSGHKPGQNVCHMFFLLISKGNALFHDRRFSRRIEPFKLGTGHSLSESPLRGGVPRHCAAARCVVLAHKFGGGIDSEILQDGENCFIGRSGAAVFAVDHFTVVGTVNNLTLLVDGSGAYQLPKQKRFVFGFDALIQQLGIEHICLDGDGMIFGCDFGQGLFLVGQLAITRGDLFF